jgi:26S proteasome regulatory subunit N8
VEALETYIVVVHPTVLLSAVDHYDRVAKDTKKRVIGALMGTYDHQTDQQRKLQVTNCFAIPFEEDKDDPDNIWYLDHIYLE